MLAMKQCGVIHIATNSIFITSKYAIKDWHMIKTNLYWFLKIHKGKNAPKTRLLNFYFSHFTRNSSGFSISNSWFWFFFRPIRELLTHMETSLLPLKSCKFWHMLGTHRYGKKINEELSKTCTEAHLGPIKNIFEFVITTLTKKYYSKL